MKRTGKNILSIFVLTVFASCTVSCAILYDGLSTGVSSLRESSGYSSGYSSSGSTSSGTSSSTSTQTDDCRYSYSRQQDGESWRPVFTRQACSSSLKITYKVRFSDGTSAQSRFVYFMSSSYPKTEKGSERYYKSGSIEILSTEWGD
jgi:hypothetical protein